MFLVCHAGWLGVWWCFVEFYGWLVVLGGCRVLLPGFLGCSIDMTYDLSNTSSISRRAGALADNTSPSLFFICRCITLTSLSSERPMGWQVWVLTGSAYFSVWVWGHTPSAVCLFHSVSADTRDTNYRVALSRKQTDPYGREARGCMREALLSVNWAPTHLVLVIVNYAWMRAYWQSNRWWLWIQPRATGVPKWQW